MMRRVVITGIGVQSPLGSSYEDLKQAVEEKKNGISKIEKFDSTILDIYVAGEIKDFDPSCYIDKKEAKRMDLSAQYALVAGHLAYEDAGFEPGQLGGNDRVATIVASGIGGIGTIQQDLDRAIKKGYERISPFFVPMAIINMVSAQVSIGLGLNGETYTPVTACSASTDALGQAYRNIKDGYSDIAFCGGTEAAIVESGMGGFASMKALSNSKDPNRASIPFDKERDGFVMGEGAALLVLEDLDHALERGAKIYAEVLGYGASSDAHHITAPLDDGKFASVAMAKAIESAGLAPKDIDYVNAHGTSTPLNDSTETMAIKNVFKDHAKDLKVSSTKSMTGHMLGGAGAIEAIFTTIALKEGLLPATLNYKIPDPACDLDYLVDGPLKKDIAYAMSNTLGFGGHNSSIILGRYDNA